MSLRVCIPVVKEGNLEEEDLESKKQRIQQRKEKNRVALGLRKGKPHVTTVQWAQVHTI